MADFKSIDWNNVIYNGQNVNKVLYNGDLVWEKDCYILYDITIDYLPSWIDNYFMLSSGVSDISIEYLTKTPVSIYKDFIYMYISTKYNKSVVKDGIVINPVEDSNGTIYDLTGCKRLRLELYYNYLIPSVNYSYPIGSPMVTVSMKNTESEALYCDIVREGTTYVRNKRLSAGLTTNIVFKALFGNNSYDFIFRDIDGNNYTQFSKNLNIPVLYNAHNITIVYTKVSGSNISILGMTNTGSTDDQLFSNNRTYTFNNIRFLRFVYRGAGGNIKVSQSKGGNELLDSSIGDVYSTINETWYVESSL